MTARSIDADTEASTKMALAMIEVKLRGMLLHGQKMHSDEDGAAKIRYAGEDLDVAVKDNQPLVNMRDAAVELGALAVRFLLDRRLTGGGP